MNLQELMQRRAQLAAEMRTYTQTHAADWNADCDARWADMDAELRETEGKIQRLQRLDAVDAELSRTDGRGAAVPPGIANPDQTPAQREERALPWNHIGEFYHDVRYNPSRAELREMTMTVGSEGGILVPTQFANELLRVTPESSVVRPRARIIPAGATPDAELSFPALAQGANGVYGGTTVTWVGENVTPNTTDATLEEVKLSPATVMADVVVSNRLLNNAAAAGPLISSLLRDAVIGSEDFAFIRGDGIGKPLGVLNCPGRVDVVRAGAGAIATADTLGMMAALHPDSWSSAMWVANQSTLPQLMTLQDANGNSIFMAGNAVNGVPPTLWGMPLKFTGRTPALGTRGDLMLVDWNYYLIKDGIGPLIRMSEHVLFRSYRTVVQIVRSVDGQGWVREPLTLEDGVNQVSPYIMLQ